MIFEHQHFFLNCIPKTGSKSTSNWCKINDMSKVDQVNLDSEKPVFATMRDQKDRIISGIFEDIFHSTLIMYNLTGLEPLIEVDHLYKKTIDEWAENCFTNVLSHQCHYANVESYFSKTTSFNDLLEVYWIHIDDILIIDQLINKELGFDVKLKPLLKENFRFDKRRPPKEYFYEIIKDNAQVMLWLENRIQKSYNPTYIKL